jgi:D-amino-acid dehydrogenase
LDPGITLDIQGSVYFPNDCHLSPNRFIEELTQRLQDAGVDIRYGRTQSGWRLANGAVSGVETIATALIGVQYAQGFVPPANPLATEVHEADVYVIAGGAWTDCIAAKLGVNLPLQGGKGYSLTLTAPRQQPKICAVLVEARAAVTPMGETLRVGGTMEIDGKDESINPRRVRGIVRSFVKYYSAFAPQDFEKVTPWRGLRPVSPDGMPYIGRLNAHPNVIVATGHAMMGLSLGPISGQMVAEQLADRTPAGFDMSLLAPDRFSD